MPAELTKAEDGEWRVRGLASTASRDLQGEIMLQDGMDLTPIDKKKGILNWDHKKGPENTLGIIDGYTKSPDGLYVEGRLFKNHDKAKAVHQIMSSLGKSDYGRMGLSVEGSIKERTGKDGTTIKRSVITGVALTMNPVNSDTYVDLTKSMTSNDIEFNASEDVQTDSDSGSESNSASSEASGPLFSSEQVLDIVRKALAIGGEKATTLPGDLSGGAALAQEDLDRKKKKAGIVNEKLEKECDKEIKKGSAKWFEKSILDAVDSLRMLYPEIETSILLTALQDRLNTKFGIKDQD